MYNIIVLLINNKLQAGSAKLLMAKSFTNDDINYNFKFSYLIPILIIVFMTDFIELILSVKLIYYYCLLSLD